MRLALEALAVTYCMQARVLLLAPALAHQSGRIRPASPVPGNATHQVEQR